MGTRINDLGDVPLPEANDNEASIQRITDYFTRLDAAGDSAPIIPHGSLLSALRLQGRGPWRSGNSAARRSWNYPTDPLHRDVDQ